MIIAPFRCRRFERWHITLHADAAVNQCYAGFLAFLRHCATADAC